MAVLGLYLRHRADHGELFYSFQAAEKAPKAVQYNVDANQKKDDHNLVLNCRGFDESDAELKDLAARLERLVINSVHMRYPDTVIPQDTPWRIHSSACRGSL